MWFLYVMYAFFAFVLIGTVYGIARTFKFHA